MEQFSMPYALLSMQVALLDAVTPELRAVVVNVSKETDVLDMHCYYHGSVSEKLIDLWDCAISEASAYVGLCELNNSVKRLDFPNKIPLFGTYAYLRKESPPLPPGSTVYPVSKKILQFDKPVGFFVSPIDGQKHETNLGIVQEESKKHTIIPVKPLQYKIPITPSAYALLSMQRALLGRVTPSLRLVTVDLSDEKSQLHIRIYYDGEISPEMLFLGEIIISNVYADCGPDYILDYEIARIDVPNKMPCYGRLAYERKEEIRQRFISTEEAHSS